MSAAVVLTPELHKELARQVALAQPCVECMSDPVLVVRNDYVRVYVSHAPECAVLAAEGGASA